MSGWRPLALTAGMAAALLYAAVYLFGLEFASGEVYPEYSSVRTDPAGTRLLYDSLAALPNVTVERNYRPLESLPDSASTVILLGIPAQQFGENQEPYLRVAEELARRGHRIVLALRLEYGGKLPKSEELVKRWNVQLALDDKVRHHSLYFGSAKGWNALYRIGSKLLAIDRDFGKGSIVIFSGSEDFTNMSTVAGDRLRLVTVALGPNRHIVFDEQHLGVVESGSMMELARRFHLLGFAAGLALCAVLLFWRKGIDFPPPAAVRAEALLAGRTSQEGLITLLRRHIAPCDLAATCWREWLNGNRGKVTPVRRERAAGIAASAAKRPLETLNEIHSALHSKGEL